MAAWRELPGDSAPEFFWLVDGSNYCGRIFKGCIR
jgi:hypothetical protein